jgi:hypothetical protein
MYMQYVRAYVRAYVRVCVCVSLCMCVCVCVCVCDLSKHGVVIQLREVGGVDVGTSEVEQAFAG